MVSYEDTARELIGLSTDTKPTEDIPNGSTFVEIDTGKLYAFDADSDSWTEQGA